MSPSRDGLNPGRWVHVKCWQSWCPGCHAHGFPALQRMVEAFDGDPRLARLHTKDFPKTADTTD